MFLDFLKAEWKTLVISGFIVLILVGGFYWSIDPVEDTSDSFVGCLVRGRSLGGISLGQSMDGIRVLKGNPVKMEDKGVWGVVWDYGEIEVYFRGGVVKSVFVQKSVLSLSACFLEAKGYFHKEIGSGIFVGEEEWIQYPSGWMIKLKKGDDKKGEELGDRILGVGVYDAYE